MYRKKRHDDVYFGILPEHELNATLFKIVINVKNCTVIFAHNKDVRFL